MIEIYTYTSGEGFKTHSYPQSVQQLLEQEGCLLWVDAENPSIEELDWIKTQFNIHPIAMEDYNSPQERARIDRYSSMYSIVLYALGFTEGTCELKERPLTLFVGKSYMVMLHEHPFPEIEEARRIWERNETDMPCEIGIALYVLIDTLVDDYFPLIDRLSEEVEDIEDDVLKSGRPDCLARIFSLKRQLISLRRAVAPERDVINVLLRRELQLFSENISIYFQDVYDHLVRVLDGLDNHRELLTGALDLYVSVSSNQLAISANRLNQTMQTMAAWSIILMTGALIAGIYGMNFEVMQELKWRYGYAFALGLMSAMGAGLFIYFRRRKWL